MRSLFFLSACFLHSVLAAGAQQDPLLDVVRLHEDVPIAADTTTATASSSSSFLEEHYGSPGDGCEDDETAFRISGIPGGVCSRKCTDFLPCPTDLPAGATATPMCALQDQSGNKYCVLVCSSAQQRGVRGTDAQCGDAVCRPIPGQGGLGVCTYDYDPE